MFERSDSRVCQHHSPRESSAFENCMIAPFELRQHEVLPISINPSKGLTNLGLNDLPKRGLSHEANGLLGKTLPPNGLPSCPQEKRFFIFDRCGDKTKLMFSALYPRVSNLGTASLFGASRFPSENRQANKEEQAWIKTPVIPEESGENEVVIEERSEMREDTEEINALLYSDDSKDYDDDDDDDDELSTGHSPLSKEEHEVKDYDEVVGFEISSKRQKNVHGESYELPSLRSTSSTGEDITCGPSPRRKRPRTQKIRDTLKTLEGIIPGHKSTNPLTILDEAISYLKSLKHDAQVMSMEDPDGSSCYEPSN